MDEICEKHKSLIDGLTKLFDILAAMHYISFSDVLRPPYTAQTMNIAYLEGLGFENEVVNLIQCLPGLRNDIRTRHRATTTVQSRELLWKS